jgi:2-dehydro-3-deoxy-D-gluconate 5-dehydrogenase
MVLDNFKLSNKVALVSGCKRGIGKAIALALAQAGADVIGVSASLESGSEIEKQIKALGRKFYPHQCDFSKRSQLYDFIKKVKAECPPVDILVNNAGSILRKPAAEHPDEYWDTIIETNLNAQFIIAREFGKDMIANKKGKIIFIASLLTFQGGVTVPGYASSKGAIGSLTKALANEWAGQGVNVNAIAPGYIATDNTDALQKDEIRNAAILSRIPSGRWGNPDDLAGAAVFLASAASDYINGTILTVDGGWMGR